MKNLVFIIYLTSIAISLIVGDLSQGFASDSDEKGTKGSLSSSGAGLPPTHEELLQGDLKKLEKQLGGSNIGNGKDPIRFGGDGLLYRNGTNEQQNETIILLDLERSGVDNHPLGCELGPQNSEEERVQFNLKQIINRKFAKFYADDFRGALDREAHPVIVPFPECELINKILSIRRVHPGFANLIAATIMKYNWAPVGHKMARVEDDGNMLLEEYEKTAGSGGELIQLAYRQGKQIRINRKWWNHPGFSSYQKVALIFHEVIYALVKLKTSQDYPGAKTQNSETARNIVGVLFGDEFESESYHNAHSEKRKTLTQFEDDLDINFGKERNWLRSEFVEFASPYNPYAKATQERDYWFEFARLTEKDQIGKPLIFPSVMRWHVRIPEKRGDPTFVDEIEFSVDRSKSLYLGDSSHSRWIRKASELCIKFSSLHIHQNELELRLSLPFKKDARRVEFKNSLIVRGNHAEQIPILEVQRLPFVLNFPLHKEFKVPVDVSIPSPVDAYLGEKRILISISDESMRGEIPDMVTKKNNECREKLFKIIDTVRTEFGLSVD